MDYKNLTDLHTSSLNFNGLHTFMVENEIPFKITRFKCPALGLAAHNMLYINEKIDNGTPLVFFYVLLHEIGHFMSFKKYGLEHHLEKLSSTDFDVFFEHVVEEEIRADRFGRIMFYKLNRYFPDDRLMQNLHLAHKKSDYATIMRNLMFRTYSNDIEEYEKAIGKFVYIEDEIQL